eukprot:CAMPEP_0184539036 /NCGR_PEP_ID=MMETSP0198_2-20121128/17914_1 /TAXON_ID=1112570 /ORGANISM="Thraustochytrium sp., Strain LLF1b" /LENGTH=1047 /DNA_ID=CAMNT_0026932529 /DNA_START=23 /DNA_END=3166 /DNA_ORIENTATION=-
MARESAAVPRGGALRGLGESSYSVVTGGSGSFEDYSEYHRAGAPAEMARAARDPAAPARYAPKGRGNVRGTGGNSLAVPKRRPPPAPVGEEEADEDPGEETRQQRLASLPLTPPRSPRLAPKQWELDFDGMEDELRRDTVRVDVLRDGSCYVGEHLGSARHGIGAVQSLGEGFLYRGDWKRNLKDGFGECLQESSGIRFEGIFLAGKAVGPGRKLWPSGSWYVGEFDDEGNPSGLGIMESGQGDVVYGSFLKGKCHGSGKIFYPSEASYVGQFKEGKRHGFGVLYPGNSAQPDQMGEWHANRFIRAHALENEMADAIRLVEADALAAMELYESVQSDIIRKVEIVKRRAINMCIVARDDLGLKFDSSLSSRRLGDQSRPRLGSNATTTSDIVSLTTATWDDSDEEHMRAVEQRDENIWAHSVSDQSESPVSPVVSDVESDAASKHSDLESDTALKHSGPEIDSDSDHGDLAREANVSSVSSSADSNNDKPKHQDISKAAQPCDEFDSILGPRSKLKEPTPRALLEEMELIRKRTAGAYLRVTTAEADAAKEGSAPATSPPGVTTSTRVNTIRSFISSKFATQLDAHRDAPVSGTDLVSQNLESEKEQILSAKQYALLWRSLHPSTNFARASKSTRVAAEPAPRAPPYPPPEARREHSDSAWSMSSLGDPQPPSEPPLNLSGASMAPSSQNGDASPFPLVPPLPEEGSGREQQHDSHGSEQDRSRRGSLAKFSQSSSYVSRSRGHSDSGMSILPRVPEGVAPEGNPVVPLPPPSKTSNSSRRPPPGVKTLPADGSIPLPPGPAPSSSSKRGFSRGQSSAPIPSSVGHLDNTIDSGKPVSSSGKSHHSSGSSTKDSFLTAPNSSVKSSTGSSVKSAPTSFATRAAAPAVIRPPGDAPTCRPMKQGSQPSVVAEAPSKPKAAQQPGNPRKPVAPPGHGIVGQKAPGAPSSQQHSISKRSTQAARSLPKGSVKAARPPPVDVKPPVHSVQVQASETVSTPRYGVVSPSTFRPQTNPPCAPLRPPYPPVGPPHPPSGQPSAPRSIPPPMPPS